MFLLQLTGLRVSRGPQGHRFHPLVRPPQAAVTSAAHPQPRSHDRLRSGERGVVPPASTAVNEMRRSWPGGTNTGLAVLFVFWA